MAGEDGVRVITERGADGIHVPLDHASLKMSATCVRLVFSCTYRFERLIGANGVC